MILRHQDIVDKLNRRKQEDRRINQAELSMKPVIVLVIMLGLIIFFGGGR
jgi:hypothetical protein